MVASVEPKYRKTIRSQITNKINKNIPEFFTYLFETYRDISLPELTSLRNQVEFMSLDLVDSVDIIFTEVQDLSDISDMVEDPSSER